MGTIGEKNWKQYLGGEKMLATKDLLNNQNQVTNWRILKMVIIRRRYFKKSQQNWHIKMVKDGCIFAISFSSFNLSSVEKNKLED